MTIIFIVMHSLAYMCTLTRTDKPLSFTHMKIALSLIKSSTAERFPNTMLMIRKKNAPLLSHREREREGEGGSYAENVTLT